MNLELGLAGSIALFVGALVGFALLFHFFAWWGRAAAVARARRIAARLHRPATSLAEVEDQSAAIEELVQFEHTQAAVAAARELLGERNGAIRSAAIEILRRTRALDQWARDLRRGSYRSRLRAIEALGQVGDERAVAELISTLGDDDPGVARAAARAALARDPDYACDRLADALSSPHRRLAETAAAALVGMGEEAVEALVNQLSNLNPQARRLTVEALGAVGGEQLAHALLHLLESDPDPEVRAAAAAAIAQVSGEGAFAHLCRLSQSDPDWFVRARAYSLLVETNREGARGFLLEALAGLARQGGPGDEREEVEVVAEGTGRLRTAVIAALRALGMSEEELARAQRTAPQTEGELAAITGDDAMADGWAETLAALKEPDPARRLEAARQLAEAGSLAAPWLGRALRDPEPLVRAEAARSLGRIGVRESLDGLAERLHDPDPGVRLSSSIALRAIVTREAARELRD